MQSVTVSYGSFSLTVDGYDDPFKVIHEITELYAKMASQYPGFGAEPMQTQVANPSATVEAEQEVTPLALDEAPIDPVLQEISELDSEPVETLEEVAETLSTEDMPQIEPLRLNTPIPRYRRIDMSQIRAAAEPLTASDFEKVEPNIRRFPVNGEN